MADPALVLEAHDRYGLPLAFTADGDVLSTGGFDGSLATWQLPAGDPVATSDGHEQSVNCGTHATTGELVTGSTDGNLGRWSLPDLSASGMHMSHTGTVAGLAAHPDAPQVASASYDATVQVWDLESPSDVTVLEGHEKNVTTVAFVDEWLVSGGLGETALVWSLDTADRVAALPDHGAAVVAVAAADGSCWTAGYDGRLREWDHSDWSVARSIDLGEAPSGLAVDPDAAHLGVTLDGEVRILEPDGTTLATHEVPIKGVSTPRWSPDGSRLVVGGADGHVRFYE